MLSVLGMYKEMMKNIIEAKISNDSKHAILTVILWFSTVLLAFFMVYQSGYSSIFTFQTITHHNTQDVSNTTNRGMITCNRSSDLYDICSTNGPTIFDPKLTTFFVNGSILKIEKVRPYARKWEQFAMSRINEVTLIEGPLDPLRTSCDVHHTVPALVFSMGFYTKNFFHDINGVFIPLFITVSSIFPNHEDFVMVISQLEDWWVEKNKVLLRGFSNHPIINYDKMNITHCFPSATVGLMSHGFMTIDPTLIPTSKTFLDFHAFLSTTYGNDKKFTSVLNMSSIDDTIRAKPRLILPSRIGSRGRLMLNQHEVKELAEKIGFEVIIFVATNRTSLTKSFSLINSSHAMLGVHGASLTHALFLRPGSVFIQIIPLGLDGVSEAFYGRIGRGMKLDYEEYTIGFQESTLLDKYGKDKINKLLAQDTGLNNAIRTIFLREQDIKIDLKRLQPYLESAYHKAKVFMDKNG